VFQFRQRVRDGSALSLSWQCLHATAPGSWVGEDPQASSALRRLRKLSVLFRHYHRI